MTGGKPDSRDPEQRGRIGDAQWPLNTGVIAEARQLRRMRKPLLLAGKKPSYNSLIEWHFSQRSCNQEQALAATHPSFLAWTENSRTA
jgi:hypothetical protein